MGSTSSMVKSLCIQCNTIHDTYGHKGWGWEYCKHCNKCIKKEDTSKVYDYEDAKIYIHCYQCNKHHDWCIRTRPTGWFALPSYDPLRFCNICKECLPSKHYHCNKCDIMLKHIHCDECSVTIDHCHKCGFVEGKNFHCTRCTECHLVYKNHFFCDICNKCVREDYKHTLNH